MSNNRKHSLDELAEILKALSNANRLKIFMRLTSCCRPGTVSYVTDKNTAFVGELGEDLNIGKSTVSHHLKELRRVGLIRTERRGQNIACWVDPEIAETLKDFFSF